MRTADLESRLAMHHANKGCNGCRESVLLRELIELRKVLRLERETFTLAEATPFGDAERAERWRRAEAACGLRHKFVDKILAEDA